MTSMVMLKTQRSFQSGVRPRQSRSVLGPSIKWRWYTRLPAANSFALSRCPDRQTPSIFSTRVSITGSNRSRRARVGKKVSGFGRLGTDLGADSTLILINADQDTPNLPRAFCDSADLRPVSNRVEH